MTTKLMDLKAIKKSIVIVTGDKDVNELVTEYIEKDFDCFGRAYKEGHPECHQCVVISEFKDFQTGEFRRDPLWVACYEACKFLSEKEQIIGQSIKEVESEMQVEKIEELETGVVGIDVAGADAEQTADFAEVTAETQKVQVPIERPKRRSVNPEGHSKTYYRTCSKCGGKKSLYASTYERALKRYGSVEEMNKKYLCKVCRKEP